MMGPHPLALEALLQGGADPYQQAGSLISSCSRCMIPVGLAALKVLLEHCNPVQRAAAQLDALGVAIGYNGVIFVPYLVSVIPSPTDSELERRLYSAAYQGNRDVMKALLSWGPPPSQRILGETLCTAVMLGHWDQVQLLLEQGASVSYSNGRPLHTAVDESDAAVPMVELLLSHGARVPLRMLKMTAAGGACVYNEVYPMLKVAYEAQAAVRAAAKRAASTPAQGGLGCLESQLQQQHLLQQEEEEDEDDSEGW